MTYDEAIEFIYANRLPKEDYGDTLKRLKHPLAKHLYGGPQCQQLTTALEQHNKLVVVDDPEFSQIVSRLRAGPLEMPYSTYQRIKNRLPLIRYAFTNPAAHLTKVRLMEETK